MGRNFRGSRHPQNFITHKIYAVLSFSWLNATTKISTYTVVRNFCMAQNFGLRSALAKLKTMTKNHDITVDKYTQRGGSTGFVILPLSLHRVSS